MGKGTYIGQKEFLVHKQDGTLLRATSGKMTSTLPPTFRIEADAGIAPHAVAVIQGTQVMLGRDVIWSTATAPGTQKMLMKTAVRLLGKGLRSQASVRFSKDASGSMRMTIIAMRNVNLNMHNVSILTAGVMGGALLGKVKENMSLTDHSLADLARLGHPYAKKHGRINIHR